MDLLIQDGREIVGEGGGLKITGQPRVPRSWCGRIIFSFVPKGFSPE
jgi:hypothetical protein